MLQKKKKIKERVNTHFSPKILLFLDNVEKCVTARQATGDNVFFFFYPKPHMSLTDFVVFPPGHGRSVTDFSG